jgi:hypothetical protein
MNMKYTTVRDSIQRHVVWQRFGSSGVISWQIARFSQKRSFSGAIVSFGAFNGWIIVALLVTALGRVHKSAPEPGLGSFSVPKPAPG